MEKDPHRNREPHYLCGSVAEEESTLTVFSPLPDVPFGDTPRSKRGYISNSNQKKRVKDEKEKQPSGKTRDDKMGALSGLKRFRISLTRNTSRVKNSIFFL